MPALDFYTSGATEKRAFIGEFTNLTDGPHTLTLRVDPDSPEGRKKISLDSFNIIKAPAVGLDSPSIAPLKEKRQRNFLKPTIWRLGSHRCNLPRCQRSSSIAQSGPNASGYKWGSDRAINPKQSSSNPNPWGYWSTNWKSDRSLCHSRNYHYEIGRASCRERV